MRCIIIFTVLCLIGLAYAYPKSEDNFPNDKAEELLAVDAGEAHENESEREARQWGGGGWGRRGWGGGGWGGRGWGRQGWGGGGWGGGGWGRGGWGGGWG